MSKAARNSKPNSPSVPPGRPTRRHSHRAIRAQLVAAGLLQADGHVIGVVDHPDKNVFVRAAKWRMARDRFGRVNQAAILAERTGDAYPLGFHAACASMLAAEKVLMACPPLTPDGVAVLLNAAVEFVDELPVPHALIAVALRRFKATGL